MTRIGCKKQVVMVDDITIQRVLRRVAKQYGMSIAEVRKNIQNMLDESRSSADKQHKEAWAMIPCSGDVPTLEEVFRFIAERLSSRQQPH